MDTLIHVSFPGTLGQAHFLLVNGFLRCVSFTLHGKCLATTVCTVHKLHTPMSPSFFQVEFPCFSTQHHILRFFFVASSVGCFSPPLFKGFVADNHVPLIPAWNSHWPRERFPGISFGAIFFSMDDTLSSMLWELGFGDALYRIPN